MAVSAFLDDGYSEDGVIPEVKGLHPEVRFRFRPALLADKQRYWKGFADASPDEQAKRTATLIASHVEGWNLTEGRPVVAQVLKMRPAIIDGIVVRILGYSPADEAADAKN